MISYNANKILKQSKVIWIKFVQVEVKRDLELSVDKMDKAKISGKYRNLAPFEDELGIWRVGLRTREYTPFTTDHQPPVLLPHHSRLTLLLMREAHERRHGGVIDTVGEFRLAGYWTPKAKLLAKSIKSKCVICKHLDCQPVGQIMGQIPKDRLIQPMAWGKVQLDLFGPFHCKSEVNKRSTKKTNICEHIQNELNRTSDMTNRLP